VLEADYLTVHADALSQEIQYSDRTAAHVDRSATCRYFDMVEEPSRFPL
jgi:hypothetical protein